MPKDDAPLIQLATRIPKRLHREIRLHCVVSDTSVMAFVAAALEARLASAEANPRPRRRRAR